MQYNGLREGTKGESLGDVQDKSEGQDIEQLSIQRAQNVLFRSVSSEIGRNREKEIVFRQFHKRAWDLKSRIPEGRYLQCVTSAQR